MLRRHFARVLAASFGAALVATRTWSQTPEPPVRKPDLGDAAEGTYEGDVISDSKGPSQSGVTLTVTRIGRNLIRITNDYPRLPVIDVPLTLAMGKILAQRGDSVFLLDKAKNRLDVTFMNEVSWSGHRV